MSLITKEEVEVLREELKLGCATEEAIKTVLQKVAAEKLMTEPEQLRVYQLAQINVETLWDYRSQDKHGAIMLQDPELWSLMEEYKVCAAKLQSHCAVMQLPGTKAEEL